MTGILFFVQVPVFIFLYPLGKSYPLLNHEKLPLVLKKQINYVEEFLEIHYRPEESMKALIQLGTQGHFPLFHASLLTDPEIKEKKFSKITGLERAKAKKLFQIISNHRQLEHKKIVLLSMKEDDRKLFMKAFLRLVEGKILDQKPEIH